MRAVSFKYGTLLDVDADMIDFFDGSNLSRYFVIAQVAHFVFLFTNSNYSPAGKSRQVKRGQFFMFRVELGHID